MNRRLLTVLIFLLAGAVVNSGPGVGVCDVGAMAKGISGGVNPPRMATHRAKTLARPARSRLGEKEFRINIHVDHRRS